MKLPKSFNRCLSASFLSLWISGNLLTDSGTAQASSEATMGAVFERLQDKCSVLNFCPLVFAVNTFLSNEETLQKELEKAFVVSFSKFAKMVDLVSLIKSHQQSVGDDHKVVKLKIRDFWIKCTMEVWNHDEYDNIGHPLLPIVPHYCGYRVCLCQLDYPTKCWLYQATSQAIVRVPPNHWSNIIPWRLCHLQCCMEKKGAKPLKQQCYKPLSWRILEQ